MRLSDIKFPTKWDHINKLADITIKHSPIATDVVSANYHSGHDDKDELYDMFMKRVKTEFNKDPASHIVGEKIPFTNPLHKEITELWTKYGKYVWHDHKVHSVLEHKWELDLLEHGRGHEEHPNVKEYVKLVSQLAFSALRHIVFDEHVHDKTSKDTLALIKKEFFN